MPAADLATSVAVDTAIPICACRSAGASLAPSPHIPTVCPFFWKALTRLNLPSGRILANTAKSSGFTPSGIAPGGQTAPSNPTAWATIAAVAGASPVTMTVRTPNVLSSEIREIESARGGSLSAISPMSCMDAAGPAATAKTLKPCFSSSSAKPVAVGDGALRLATTVKAPLMMRSTPAFASVAVASDVFLAGSNGTNAISCGRSDAGLLVEAERIAASTASSGCCWKATT